MQASIVTRAKNSIPNQLIRRRFALKCWSYLLLAIIVLCCAFGIEVRVLGQTQHQVYGTGLKNNCPGNEIAVASISTRMNDQQQTEARALCLALLPEGGKQPDKMFCVYKFGSDVLKRDDDKGVPILRDYAPTKLTGNLATFFQVAKCNPDNGLLQTLSGAMDNITSAGSDFSAQNLIIQTNSLPQNQAKVGETKSLLNIADQASFPNVAHSYFAGLFPPTPVPTPTPVQSIASLSNRIKQLEGELEQEHQLSAGLKNEIDDLKQYLIWLIGVLGFVIASSGGIAFHYNRRLARQSERENSIREETHKKLFLELHRGDQLSDNGKKLADILNGFMQNYLQIKEELNIPFNDEKKIRSQFVKDLRDLRTSLYENQDDQKPSKKALDEIAESYFHHYSQLLRHTENVEKEYKNLYASLWNSVRDYLLTNLMPDQKDDESGQPGNPGSELPTGQASGEISLSRHTLAFAQLLDDRLAKLTGRDDSNAMLRELELMERRLRHIWDKYNDQGGGYSANKIIGLIHAKLNETQDLKARNDTTEKVLNPLMKSHETVFEAIKRIADDQKLALAMLPVYRPAAAFSVAEKIKLISDKLSLASDVIKREVPDAGGEIDQIDQLVNKTLNELRRVRTEADEARKLKEEKNKYEARLKIIEPEVSTGADFVRETSRYLGFNTEKIFQSSQPVSTALSVMRSEAPNYQDLRFRLLAVRSALDYTLARTEQERIIKLLRVERWRTNLEAILPELQTFTGNDLWQKCLFGGFNNQWLHEILRANLLLNSYFSINQDLFFLHDAVLQASQAMLSALRKLDVKVAEIKLFEPPLAGMQVDRTAGQLLRQFPEVEAKVLQKFAESGSSFVIDVLSFPFKVGRESYDVGCVVVMNPADWLQK